MIFFHASMLTRVPTQVLLVAHMRLCGIRSRDWGSPSPSAWYYSMPYNAFYAYHYEVMSEMRERGFSPSPEWLDVHYTGKRKGFNGTWRVRSASVQDYEKYLPHGTDSEEAYIVAWEARHG